MGARESARDTKSQIWNLCSTHSVTQNMLMFAFGLLYDIYSVLPGLGGRNDDIQLVGLLCGSVIWHRETRILTLPLYRLFF